jgi:hypothetical protein
VRDLIDPPLPKRYVLRSHLENLLNEKKLRDELVLFSVDEKNCVIAPEHRASLMPVLLKYDCT